MTSESAAKQLETSIRDAFERLSADLAMDPGAGRVRVRAAPFDAAARFHFAAEEAVVAHAVDARRREFATGRRIAHALLAEAGWTPAPLLPGTRRAPAWPAGIVGTISHARGIAVASIAPHPPYTSIGLDVEGADPLSPALIDTVVSAREIERFAALEGTLGSWAKLAFSAKECAYKAWSPMLDAVPEFGDVDVEFDPTRASFVARLHPRRHTASALVLHGRYARCGECVYTLSLAADPARR